MKQAAELLGKSEDVEKYRELAAAVKKAFNEKFFDKETRKYDRNSQAANAMALYVGLVEPENEEIVFQNLIDDIRSRGNALTAGDTTVCWDTSIHGFLPDWVESRRPIHRPPTRRS